MVGGIDMKKYKPIRIHHINYGYGYWWGSYFFFIGRQATCFAIVPMFMECDKTIYTHNGLSVGRGDTLSWSASRQRVNAEEVKMPK